ncbi:MAG: hypothetical protein IT325_08610, partial [Anaerolineae bacterium]|nr:hypothetical protein [Anaerolineae bacterium]
MRKFIIEDHHLIAPFNEPARDLSILNKPLKIHHADILDDVIGPTAVDLPLSTVHDLPHVAPGRDECVAYRDNLYFDIEFFSAFFEQARASQLPSRAVLPASDAAWMKYSVPLSRLEPVRDHSGAPLHYPLDLWYFPKGYVEQRQWRDVPVFSDYREKGYYNVPDSMSNIKLGGQVGIAERDLDLTHLLTERSCLSIDSWVHVYFANIILGVFSRGSRFEEYLSRHNLFAL